MVTAEDDGRWSCGHCGEWFRDEEDLVDHKQVAHGGCNLCIYYLQGYEIREALKFDTQLAMDLEEYEA